jgi:protein required for attachment to host cells
MEDIMSAIKIDTGHWVVVCDGAKALIMENTGTRSTPNLQVRETREQATSRTSDMGSERPGRVHESAGGGRSSVAQTDWHDQGERDFLGALASRLDEMVKGGKIRALIVVAAPRALGMLREAFSPEVRKVVAAEVDKDYVKLPVPEITRQLIAA